MSAVIFDLDGVLVDSEPYWQRGFAEATNAWCVSRGLPDPGLSPAHMERFQGGRVNDTMSTILAGLGYADMLDAEVVGELTAQVVARVSADFMAHPTPIPSSVAVARLLAGMGTRLAVASSSAQAFIDAAVDAIGLSGVFESTQSALLLAHGKPHPDVYLRTMADLGLSARDCMAIEDSTTGLVSALLAGLRTVWLLADLEESEAAARERLEQAMAGAGADRQLGTSLVRITRELTLADIESMEASP